MMSFFTQLQTLSLLHQSYFYQYIFFFFWSNFLSIYHVDLFSRLSLNMTILLIFGFFMATGPNFSLIIVKLTLKKKIIVKLTSGAIVS